MDPTLANRPQDLTPEQRGSEFDDPPAGAQDAPLGEDSGLARPARDRSVKPGRSAMAWALPLLILAGLLAAAFAWHQSSGENGRIHNVNEAPPVGRPSDVRR